MKTAAFFCGLVLICSSQFTHVTAEEAVVQSECRDRYFWIHVVSGQTPRFEAIDDHGAHSISEQLASRCGYTISTYKMDGFTTFRASYYSCFTHNQNDEVFTFRFNIMVNDAHGQWVSWPVSAACSGLTLTDREIICEEDYMEVNVNRQSTCEGATSGHVWQAAFARAQRMANSVWQLMFLHADGQVSSMTVREAQSLGYGLTASSQRVVLRSQYKQPQAEVKLVEGIPVEVVQVSLFFKQKLVVMMIDVSMACAVNAGSFEGGWLLWDVPQVLSPLVGDGVGFESHGISLGVEGLLLDESTAAARGFSVVQGGPLIRIGVPFGADGGYRKSLVINNMYKEMYVIFLVYEHVFSLLYEDGSTIATRHRMLKVLETPLLCHSPYSIDQTINDTQVFSIYLGNVPSDVVLEDVWINGKQLRLSESVERGFSISPVVHVNGSRAYNLRLPFEDDVVHWKYLGEGLVQYSIDINFTLTIMPQRESYYHQAVITARVFNTFPPEITAQCSDKGIVFSVVRLPKAQSLWEVGIDHEPLTTELASQRGYILYEENQRTTLEIPVFSVGYTYEDINLSSFYGTFQLLLRDSKTLEVQTSTSKRCLFKTQDMIVCSTDGTMTVVTTLATTWPTVHPERTTLLDPTCRPKYSDGSRVLFEFQVDSCGTRAMAGDAYIVYENEILHDRQLIPDGPNFISRESNFKLTVRCFYPLSGVSRLSVDRMFRSEIPGFGSVNVYKNLQDPGMKLPTQHCVPGNAVNTQTNQVPQASAAGGVRPQPSHHIETQVQHAFGSSTGDHLRNVPPGYDQLVDISLQLSNLSTQSLNFVVRGENHELTEEAPHLVSQPYRRIPNYPVVGMKIDSGRSGQTVTLQGPNSLGKNIRQPGLMSNHPPLGPHHIPNQDLKGLKVDLGMQALNLQNGVNMELSLHGSPSGGKEVAKKEAKPGRRPQSPSVPSRFPPVAQYSPVLSNKDKIYLPVQHITLKNRSRSAEPIFSATSQVIGNLERPGSAEKRNIEMSHSKVQNIRVKPPSKFVSSAHHLNPKPFVQPMKSQYTTVPSAGTSHMTPQPLPEPRGSGIQKSVPERVSTAQKQEQRIQSLKSDQTTSRHRSSLFPNLQIQQKKPSHLSPEQQDLVQPVTWRGKGGGQESTPTLKNVLQPAGVSHIRVRPTITTSYQGVAPESIHKVPVSIREQNILTQRGAGSPGVHTNPRGSGGSVLNGHTTSDCSVQSRASVHQGIIRGKPFS